MKIICVEKNYKPQEKPEKPILFMKPETALTRIDWPFFVPDWSEQTECEMHLVVRINHLGKSIPERYAHRYYDEVALGVDFTARDIQKQLADKGLPWEISKGFDGASYIGSWIKLEELRKDSSKKTITEETSPIQNLHFEMRINDEICQSVSTQEMLHSVDQIVSYVSQFYLLKTGDLIFTGTPQGAKVVKEGDFIVGMLENREILQCRCK